MSMLRNVGPADRIVRALFGAVLMGIAVIAVLGTTAAIALGLGGAILVGTAAVGFCPLYRLFGLNTCGRRLRAR